MKDNIIVGLQKLTLLDYPGKAACTLFTRGCNFKCPFCHNASLVVRADEQKPYANADILAFLKKRAGVLDGVAITGGEPTLVSGLYDLIKEIKALGYAVKLDTNGTRPEVIRRLVEDNLVDYVAMDIKNHPSKYAYTVGLPDSYDLSPIIESKNYLMEGHVDFEFRTTVAKPFHTEEDFHIIGEWLKGSEKYFLQQFKDSGDIIGKEISSYNESEMENFLNVLLPFMPNAQLRGV
ncbi:MAG: anaerobic ribonucleoside-triphosphate reductase activating protein [Clostridia bacterium]|nr:anaerobic ribonucleoside-triphosphate reductase activating protein [Clostridia bacterium]